MSIKEVSAFFVALRQARDTEQMTFNQVFLRRRTIRQETIGLNGRLITFMFRRQTMYKQTLCVTLPISAAVIVAAALFAKAGDLNPPPGDIQPTMHTLAEIYDLVQQSSPCSGCTWQYWSKVFGTSEDVQAISGSGLLHGLWLRGSAENLFGHVEVFNGPPADQDLIGDFFSWSPTSDIHLANEFFELNVEFDNGLYVRTSSQGSGYVTLLHRSPNR